MFNTYDYKHGKCELFAIVLNKYLGYPIRFYIDPEGDIESFDEPMPVLIHACNILNNNTLIDVEGKIKTENILDEFDYYDIDIIDVNSKEEAINVLKDINLPYRMNKDEENFITEHIKNNLSKYSK
jgi:hypothetical protein